MTEEKIKSVRPRLLPGTVPSIFCHTRSSAAAKKPVPSRGAVAKRERLRLG